MLRCEYHKQKRNIPTKIRYNKYIYFPTNIVGFSFSQSLLSLFARISVSYSNRTTVQILIRNNCQDFSVYRLRCICCCQNSTIFAPEFFFIFGVCTIHRFRSRLFFDCHPITFAWAKSRKIKKKETPLQKWQIVAGDRVPIFMYYILLKACLHSRYETRQRSNALWIVIDGFLPVTLFILYYVMGICSMKDKKKIINMIW